MVLEVNRLVFNNGPCQGHNYINRRMSFLNSLIKRQRPPLMQIRYQGKNVLSIRIATTCFTIVQHRMNALTQSHKPTSQYAVIGWAHSAVQGIVRCRPYAGNIGISCSLIIFYVRVNV